MKKLIWIGISLLTIAVVFPWIASNKQRTRTNVLPTDVEVTQPSTSNILTWGRSASPTYNGAMTLGFTTDNALVGAHLDGQLRIWDITTKQNTKTAPLSPFLLAGSFVQPLTFSRDGKLGAAQGVQEPTSYPLNPETMEIGPAIPGREHRNEIFIWDLTTGGQVGVFALRGDYAQFDIAFSADGKEIVVGGETLASARDDTRTKLPATTPRGQVEIWNWKSKTLKWKRSINEPVNAVSLADNGNIAIGGGSLVSNGVKGGTNSKAYDRGGMISVWNPKINKQLMKRKLSSIAVDIALSPNAKWVTVAQFFRGTRVWNAQTGALHSILKCPVSEHHGGTFMGDPRIESLIISGDSRFVAGSAERGRHGVKVWRLSNGQFVGSYNTVGWKGRQSEPTDDAFALSPDGKSLAVGSSAINEIAIYPLP